MTFLHNFKRFNDSKHFKGNKFMTIETYELFEKPKNVYNDENYNFVTEKNAFCFLAIFLSEIFPSKILN